MNKIDAIYQNFATQALYMWQLGWAEASAGNISYRFSEPNWKRFIYQSPWIPIVMSENNPLEGIADTTLLITASGSRMRRIAENPEDALCRIKINEYGTHYMYESSSANVQPSSELTTHLWLHNNMVLHKPANKVCLHAHATSTVACTNRKDLQSTETFNKMLQDAHAEFKAFLPNGIQLVPITDNQPSSWVKPSVKAIQKSPVLLWQNHGSLAVGETLDHAMDLLQVVDKCCKLYLLNH